MNANLSNTICGVSLFIMVLLAGCQKEELVPAITNEYRIESRGAGVNCSTGLTTTYPATVCAGENFTLTTDGPCGRWKIQETTTGAACGSETEWIDLNGAFTCAGVYSYSTTTPRAPGVYSFRTVHLQSKTGQCTNSACTTFSGEQYCCFTVTVAGCGCENSLEASVSCATGTTGDGCAYNRSATFTYTAGDDYDDIVIQGGLTHFTTICSATSSANLTRNTTHSGVQNSESNVTRWEASDVDACEEFTITILWSSTNGDEEITGDWSVKDGDGNVLATLGPLTCPL